MHWLGKPCIGFLHVFCIFASRVPSSTDYIEAAVAFYDICSLWLHWCSVAPGGDSYRTRSEIQHQALDSFSWLSLRAHSGSISKWTGNPWLKHGQLHSNRTPDLRVCGVNLTVLVLPNDLENWWTLASTSYVCHAVNIEAAVLICSLKLCFDLGRQSWGWDCVRVKTKLLVSVSFPSCLKVMMSNIEI